MTSNTLSSQTRLPRGHADYCDPGIEALFKRHDLTDFETLWNARAHDVDVPNHERGGVSTVSLLELDDEDGNTKRFFLKRQTNHLARSLQRPLGEPTFSREWRAIRHYHALGIPAVKAAWYGERKNKTSHQSSPASEWRAILVTVALENRTDLEHWHAGWGTLDDILRSQIIMASARLTHLIHANGMMHGCLFPKHLFLSDPSNTPSSPMNAVIIDLEKTRHFVLERHERLRDLSVLWRRLTQWQESDWRAFLAVYCDCSPNDAKVDRWLERLDKRASRR